MKSNYFYAVFFGMMVLTTTSRSQNILFDGDFNQTTEIVPFDDPTPPLNVWAYRVNENSGAEANPSVVDGVAKIQIQNPGYDYPDVQLTQLGFPLTEGHIYQLSFEVRADTDRYLRLFLGEEGGSAANLIGFDKFWYDVTGEWQTISLEFIATSVFNLHKLSFELGANDITTYFDNVILQDLGPVPPEKVVIAGTFQSAMGCETDWDPGCEITELTFDSSTDLYSGTFEIPEGNHRYKVSVGDSWDINYGENGLYGGADIFLCVPTGPEEVTFTYDPATHLVTTTPVASGFSPDCLPIVVLAGTFQDELGCTGEWIPDCANTQLIYNSGSGLFEGDLSIPAGCYEYRVVLENSWQNSFGQEGIFNGENYSLYIPSNPEITHFTYDPISHVVTSSPYDRPPQEVTSVSLTGNFQEEIGCAYDYDPNCDISNLRLNMETGAWEGSFTLPAGCYAYRVREIFSCNTETVYGENGAYWGEEIQLYVPSDGEITFSYDPQTHLITSTPYSEVPQDLTIVSLVGSLQSELGCESDSDFECDNPALTFNPDTNAWEGTFSLPAGCYFYMVKETSACSSLTYGENQLYVPVDGEITFSYDAETHIMTSTPYSGVPQEVTEVSLFGSLQEEMGCASDYTFECDNSTLTLNTDTGVWEGSFILPAGCYSYRVNERFGCNETLYGENGEGGIEIQLHVPEDGEITFSYDPVTHTIQTSPYSGVPQEVTKIYLVGTLQDELGCSSEYEEDCENSALVLNFGSGKWEGNFTLPSGCYSYRVREISACNITSYGENGIEGANPIQLFVPLDGEIAFIYDPQTHLMNSTPYSGVPQEVTSVSLVGSLQGELGCDNEYDLECDYSALKLNPETGSWEGSFSLPAGCYSYMVKETFGCDVTMYGADGSPWGADIRLYLPSDAEIKFSYDPQTHILSSTPYSGVPEEVVKVSLLGSLQDELGCGSDYDYECDNPGLIYHPNSGLWEGSFTLPAGCYSYQVKETFGCEVILYGEDGINGGNEIQLYVPEGGEITFSYDPETHTLTSTPYSGVPQEVKKVSLIGSLQDESGCVSDYDYECDNPALEFNSDSGAWEGSFMLPAGCYTYRVKETSVCNINFYGEDGYDWGEIQLYLPVDAEITFSYDPLTHIMSSTPYSGAPLEVTKVSLTGSLQNELGCASDDDYTCDKPALVLNADSGMWEGSFTLPAGCYFYWVKETIGCIETIFYGENGEIYGNYIPLYVPFEEEFTFIYDPQTHIISSTPYFDISTANQCPANILVNNTPGLCGAIVDYPEFLETVYCGGEIISIIQTEGLASGSLFPVGTTTNTFVLTKLTGEEITCSFDVVITDTEAPVISNLNQVYEPLWPPNHKMVPVFIDYIASDNCNTATTVVSVSSNESQTSHGKGDMAPDWEIVDEHNVLLRAERDPKGTGRDYYINIKVTDDSGNYTEEVVTVLVPHNKGKATEGTDLAEPGKDIYMLYPTPADNVVKIKGPESVSKRSYSIYDMLGVMKLKGLIHDDQVEVHSLPSGTYVLKFGTDKGIISKQFIKK